MFSLFFTYFSERRNINLYKNIQILSFLVANATFTPPENCLRLTIEVENFIYTRLPGMYTTITSIIFLI